jgi:predicted nucleic acid-binding protein
MRVFLDTCILNRIADDRDNCRDLLPLISAKRITPVVAAEISTEIHATKYPERLETLLAVLRPFFPVTPTNVPVAGIARSGAMRSAPKDAEELRAKLLKLGFTGWDVLHLMNAHYERCNVFLTTDNDTILEHRDKLAGVLTPAILSPQELFGRL